jgi:hypothetical protein
LCFQAQGSQSSLSLAREFLHAKKFLVFDQAGDRGSSLSPSVSTTRSAASSISRILRWLVTTALFDAGEPDIILGAMYLNLVLVFEAN